MIICLTDLKKKEERNIEKKERKEKENIGSITIGSMNYLEFKYQEADRNNKLYCKERQTI